MEKAAKEFDSFLLDEDTVWPKSMAYVPIISEGKSIGMIGLSDTERENAYDAASVRLIESLAASLGIALTNVRLFDETIRRAADLALINEIQQGLSERLEFQAIIDLVGDKLRSIFKTQNLVIMHYDPESDLCYWPYAHFQGKRHSIDPLPPGGFSGHVIRTGKSIVVNEDMLEKAKQFDSELLVEDVDIPKSIAYVPIMAEGKVIGVIGLSDTEKEHAYDASSVRLIESLAASLGIALSNVRLFDETNQRAADLAVINEIQQGLAAKLDFQEIIELVGDKLLAIFKTHELAIVMYDAKSNLCDWVYAYWQGQRMTVDPLPPSGFTGHIIETGKTIVVNEDLKRTAKEYGSKSLYGVEMPKSLAYVPILAEGQVIGVIALSNTEQENAYDASSVRLVESLAASLGIALSNVRLFEETNQRAAELAVINSVQRGLVAMRTLHRVGEIVRVALALCFIYGLHYIRFCSIADCRNYLLVIRIKYLDKHYGC